VEHPTRFSYFIRAGSHKGGTDDAGRDEITRDSIYGRVLSVSKHSLTFPYGKPSSTRFMIGS
jgi:hypothetical protein